MTPAWMSPSTTPGRGRYSLELETRDVHNDERTEAALRAARSVSSLL